MSSTYLELKKPMLQLGAKKRPPSYPSTYLWVVISTISPLERILPGAGSFALTLVVVVSMMASVVFLRVARPPSAVMWVGASLLILAATLTTIPRSGNWTGHLYAGLLLAGLVGVGPFVAAWLASNVPRVLGYCAIGFFATQTLSSMAGLVQTRGVAIYGQEVSLGRAPGLNGHSNVLGVFAALAVICCASALMGSRGKLSRRLGLVVVLLLNLGGLLVSGSVSSMLALVIGFGVMMITKRARLRVPVIVGMTLVLVWFWLSRQRTFAFRTPMERFLQVTGQTRQIGTLDIRLDTVAFAWHRIQASPLFGVGLDDMSGATYNGVTLTHNILIRAWYQGGLAMALAFVAISMIVLLAVLQSVRTGSGSAAAGAIVALSVFALTAAVFQQVSYWLPLLGCLAAAWVMSPVDKPRGGVEMNPSPATVDHIER